MLPPPKFLTGKHPDRGLLWASIDPNVNYLEPRITDGRFAAYLAPYQSEDAALEALVEAGATHIEAEAGRKRCGR